jgi:adenine/guanine phosphoribosyltransferase-like PRPP-binding protein
MVKLPERKQNPKGYKISQDSPQDTIEQLKNSETLRLSQSKLTPEYLAQFQEELSQSIRVIESFPIMGVTFYDLTSVLVDNYFLTGIPVHLNTLLTKTDFIVSPEARGFFYGPLIASMQGAGFIPLRKEGKVPAYSEHSRLTFESSSEYGSSSFQLNIEILSLMASLYLDNHARQAFHAFKVQITPFLKDNGFSDEVISSLRYNHYFSDAQVAAMSQTVRDTYLEQYNIYKSKVESLHVSELSITIVDDVLATGNTALSIIAFFEEYGFHVKQFASILEIESLGGRSLLEKEGVKVVSLLKV